MGSNTTENPKLKFFCEIYILSQLKVHQIVLLYTVTYKMN